VFDGRKEGHTAKKYALSPAPSLPEPSLYFAYGGPQCLVSSPFVGCSTFMTSALILVSMWESHSRNSCWIVPQVPQNLCAIWLYFLLAYFLNQYLRRLTPARTLVISKTLYPFRGRVISYPATSANPLRRMLQHTDREELIRRTAREAPWSHCRNIEAVISCRYQISRPWRAEVGEV
jgi:hypothetical protein